MLNSALEVVQKLENNGFKAYIVGGFVRDYLLGIKTSDIDICTNAKPKEIIDIFENTSLPKEDYGSVSVSHKKYIFEVTTFRKEANYSDYRHPEEVIYIDDLEEDLNRRDFTINTICIDKNGKVLDILGGSKDLNLKVIRTVGDSNTKFHDDPLRILRAIRFMSKLNFELSDDVIEAVKNNKHLLKKISYDRKKQELDKILLCKNAKKAMDTIIKLELDKELEINNLDAIVLSDSLVGMWAQLDIPNNSYTFSSSEKELIKNIRKAVKLDNLDSYNLYKYGLYVNSVAGVIKGISRSTITKEYEKLVITSRKDINITSYDIMNNLNIKPGPKINKIYGELEKEILKGTLKNKKEDIIEYCLKKFSSDIK